MPRVGLVLYCSGALLQLRSIGEKPTCTRLRVFFAWNLYLAGEGGGSRWRKGTFGENMFSDDCSRGDLDLKNLAHCWDP